MISGQLARAVRLFTQFYVGTRKSLWHFWPPRLEQQIKFVLTISPEVKVIQNEK